MTIVFLITNFVSTTIFYYRYSPRVSRYNNLVMKITVALLFKRYIQISSMLIKCTHAVTTHVTIKGTYF